MILCLDVGNTNIFGGVFLNENIELRFRYDTKQSSSSDQLGLFLRTVLNENSINPNKIKHIAICSVVPSIDYSLRAACKKYFQIDPFFLQAGVKTGLNIQVKNPAEVGADRIANAVAAVNLYPKKNIIIIDLGTATTFCAITTERCYLGGAIMPGIRTAMESLQSKTAKLSAVEIIKPNQAVGRATTCNIQSGLYFGQLGAMRELTRLFTEEIFNNKHPIIIGTGGFTHLFQEDKIFDVILPDLVLHGLKIALQINS
jgi:type III pantothenate kinase